MPYTREQAFRSLASWKPAEVFLLSYERKRLPENLHIYFGPPEELFHMSDDEDGASDWRRLVPILDDGNLGIITFHDPTGPTLVQIDIESPGQVIATFRHWQQYLAELMLQIGESLKNDEDLGRIATLIEFRDVDRLFAFYESAEDLRAEDYALERRRFVASSAE